MGDEGDPVRPDVGGRVAATRNLPAAEAIARRLAIAFSGRNARRLMDEDRVVIGLLDPRMVIPSAYP